MALSGDDPDIRDARLHVILGGNGDYYIMVHEMNRTMRGEKGDLIEQNDSLGIRISTSGGRAPTEVRLAVADLYRALEKHGLNKFPQEEED